MPIALQRPPKKRTTVFVATALVLAITAAGVVAVQRRDDPAPALVREHTTTVPVQRGKLSTTTIVQGALLYAGRRTLAAGLAGVVTDLPPTGALIEFGEPLYRVNMQPAVLLKGSVPMWRAFERGMQDGPDVRQLENALRAMGVFPGAVDESFSDDTASAIERMQRALGERCAAPRPVTAIPPTAADAPSSSAVGPSTPATTSASTETTDPLVPTCGVLQLGAAVFGTRAVRVAARRTTVGATVEPGSPVLTLSSPVRVIRADVKLNDARLARKGAAATVALPDGTRVKGRVARVGAATERRTEGSNTTTVVIPATIAVGNQRRLGRLDLAPVTVELAGAQRRGVLSVPVEALVALNDTHFAVEVPTAVNATKRLPVKTGLFAAGRVEISGRGIHAGLRVIVPDT